METVKAKRNAKDTVFSNLFSIPEYQLQLYQALHPEDKDVELSMLTDVTIQNVLTDRIYNDLGFMVRNKLMILVEAQSTWSENIVVRALLYLAQSYHELFESRLDNLYSSRKIALPEPGLRTRPRKSAGNRKRLSQKKKVPPKRIRYPFRRDLMF